VHGRFLEFLPGEAMTDESGLAAPSLETLSPAAAARRMRSMGLKPNRRLSQSFLNTPHVARAMVSAAEVSSDDVVLEIGPGLGVLTRELITAARQVVCVELDTNLAATLAATLGDPPNLTVVQGDANSIDLNELVAEPYVVVASLPYHVATPILFRLAFELPRPRRIVVMLQEEVATRIVGRPGASTFLGVALSTVASARLIRRVPPGAFYPPPKVQSAIVRLDLHENPTIQIADAAAFLDFLHAGFTQPRRQLHNSLSQGLGLPSSDVKAALDALAIDSSRRPADLSLQEWTVIHSAVVARGWHS
jgi:16S rRNA (adenine1518-N6/adenine1519-N6)-dimethyltransferase